MIKKRTISTKVFSVKSNGAIATRQPSQITMEVEHETAISASLFYMAEKKNIVPEDGLIGFELSALYEEPEDEKINIEVVEE